MESDTYVDTTCVVCQAEFLDPEDLKIHVNQMHYSERKKDRYCQFCSVLFTDAEKYAIHIRDIHLCSMKCCKYCSRAFMDLDQLGNHESKHYNKNNYIRYSCSQCKMLFSSLRALVQHEIDNHYDEGDGVLFNSNCMPLLSSVLNIKACTFLKSLGDDAIYICVKCKYSSNKLARYVKHLQKNGCRAIVCDQCSNVYRNKSGLIKHVNSGSSCYKLYNKSLSNRAYKGHIEKKECGIIKCQTCDILFDTVYELSEHQTEKHPVKVSLQKCKYCSKDYVGIFALNKHIERIHKHEIHLYKYVCNYCDEPPIYKHPKNLLAHFATKHRDLSPFTCKICCIKFRLRKKFTLHIKLNHDSIGFIEVDDNYQVCFTDKEPEKQKKDANTKCGVENSTVSAMDLDTGAESNDYLDTTTDTENKLENVKSKDLNPIQKIASPEYDNQEIYLDITEDKSHNSSHSNDNESSNEDDRPLLALLKRKKSVLKKKNLNKKRALKEKKLKCNICDKIFGTFAQYHHHLSTHPKPKLKTCIKCSKIFKSLEELNEHIASEHSSSKLTETLKLLLEKQRQNKQAPKTNLNHKLTMSEKFKETIKKVKIDYTSSSANITKMSKAGLSVQTFIENFTPEPNVTSKINSVTNNHVTIKKIKGPPVSNDIIKMTKFQQEPPKNVSLRLKLRMPQKFRSEQSDQNIVTSIKLVNKPFNKPILNFDLKKDSDSNVYEELLHDSMDYIEDDTQVEDDTSETAIPDIAEEVMLDASEEYVDTKSHETSFDKPSNSIAQVIHNVTIPKLPSEYKQIRIAHLSRNAPYYKIVKMDDIMNTSKQEETNYDPKEPIELPSGIKIVNVNPLAHLLGEKSIESILKPSKYHHKPKNIASAIKKAMRDLENPTPTTKKRGFNIKNKNQPVET